MTTTATLSDGILDAPIPAPGGWRRADVRTEDYRVVLSPACLDEIRRAAELVERHPLPTILLDPAEFDLPQCRAAMTRVRTALDDGVRFAVVDRLPIEALSLDAAKAMYWLLASLVARPVAQKLDGTMIYDVHDTGAQALPGSGVRPDKTNIELKPHNDNSYNRMPPDHVALLCVRAARSGGRSRVMSFLTAHNLMRERHRALLSRLYQPFWFDRQREFFPGEAPIFAAPVYDYDGVLRTRFSSHQIHGGYVLKGEPIDAAGAAAIAALGEMFDDPDLTVEFEMAPGELQFVNNRAIGHSRTAFEDHPEPERRRHLVRLWLRDHGRRAYTG
ncbi:MAG TPA: TauD/TfdA family dioxygenase [Candidatus Sulfotelmatobacter sp.]|nr:TauD/TfdA family dioxygenase [Candidatus Sulfotelmatobacter sp.]